MKINKCIVIFTCHRIWIAPIVLLFLVSCNLKEEKSKAFFKNQLVMESNDSVAAYAIPNIVSTPAGTVLCFATARLGDNHDWGNIQKVVVSISDDGGKSWVCPKTIASIKNWTVRQTSAIVDRENGKIMVFGHKSPLLNSDGERMSEIWKVNFPEKMKELGAGYFYVESFDEGKTWSEMIDVDLPYAPHDPGIVLRKGKYKGRYILPARTVIGTAFDWNNLYNGVLISDDKGKTWRAGGLSQSHVGEACVVELSDGRVYVNNRNHAENFGIRNHAISYDGGESFTELGDDPQLIEPTCDAGMVSFIDPEKGHVILFSNPAVKATKRWDGDSRKRMSVKVSFDDAKTWPINKLVFEGPSAYSGITVGKDGMIYLVYEHAGIGSKDSRQNLSVATFNMAWLEEEEIEPPKIHGELSIFYKKQEITISAKKDARIFYTLDGSNPDENAKSYFKPFNLYESTIVKAISTKNRKKSIISVSKFVRSQYKQPAYNTTFSEKYPASGQYALVDGIKGSINFHDGNWQGFEGENLEVVIDLDSIREIRNVAVGFLQNIDHWIFYPKNLSVQLSQDGKVYEKEVLIYNDIPDKETQPSKQKLSIEFAGKNARYIKVKAKNIGICPEWHKGAGKNAWLFVDEILVN
jgi:hypothetical protein